MYPLRIRRDPAGWRYHLHWYQGRLVRFYFQVVERTDEGLRMQCPFDHQHIVVKKPGL